MSDKWRRHRCAVALQSTLRHRRLALFVGGLDFVEPGGGLSDRTHGAGQCGHRSRRIRHNRQIVLVAPHRHAGEDWVRPHMDDLAVLVRLMVTLDPRHFGIDGQDHVRRLKPVAEVIPAVHRVRRGQRVLDRKMLHHRQGVIGHEAVQDAAQAFIRIAPLRNHQWVLGARQPLGRLLNRGRIRRGQGRNGLARKIHRLIAGPGLGQGFARQLQIHRPTRRRIGNGVGPVGQIGCRFRIAQFVIPLGRFPDQTRLIEHFLTILDRRHAGAQPVMFGQRRSAGHHDQRHIIALGIDQSHDRVRQAHIHVHHGRLGPARRQIVAVRHGDGRRLVGHDQGLRHGQVLQRAVGKGLDHRGEVGAGIAEQIVHADIFEPHQQRLCGVLGDWIIGHFASLLPEWLLAIMLSGLLRVKRCLSVRRQRGSGSP